ncbi:MAG: Ig-like domain-containing protein, partial [Luteolibacter sp.]|uniref:tandem-95 repeat protein n=1 Tax=Luteolibacter sp. TaxID=1962973 RepID=UPI003263AF48
MTISRDAFVERTGIQAVACPDSPSVVKLRNRFYSRGLLGFVGMMAALSVSQAAVTDAVVSKNGPQLNQGRVKGSVRVMTGENMNLNSGLTIDGSLIVPGTPLLTLNGGAASPPIQNGSGSAQPSNYRITINGGVSLGSITRKEDAVSLPVATAPVAGTGTRAVNLNQAADSPGNFATIRTLTVNAQGMTVNLPPGRYERITLNGASTLNFQAGTAAAPALYEIQQIDINGGSHLMVSGPVALRLKNSLNINGYVGNASHPEWLEMSVSGGSLTLNSQSAFHGKAVVSAGALTVNGNSLLHGLAFTDRLTLNGGGVIECEASGGTPNLAPVATAGEISTSIDAPVSIPLQASDPENSPLTYQVTVPPAHGTLSAAGAVVIYTPASGFVGNDGFSFKVSDGTADSNTVAVVIHVFQPNRAPVAGNPIFVINQGEGNAPVVLSATDPDGDAVTYQIVGQPQLGTLSGTPPLLTYSHTGVRSNSVVTDSFTYKATDSHGAVSAVGAVSLQLQPVNRAPSSGSLAVTGNEDSVIPVTLTGIDPDGDVLVYQIVVDPGNPQAVSGPSHGVLSGTAPQLSYQPAPNFNGTDRFYYKVTDGTLSSQIAEVVVTVLPANDAPVAVSKTVVTNEDQGISIALDASDVDGDSLVFTISSGNDFPGTLVKSGFNVLFTPRADFNGVASFSFTATDGSGTSATGQISLTVNPVNDAPVAVSKTVETNEDQSVSFPLDASDADGDALGYAISTAVDFPGTLVRSGSNVLFTPRADFNGAASFSFTATDGAGAISTGQITLTVHPVNDAPVALAASVSTDESVAVPIILAGTDVENDPLVYEAVAQPQHGSLSGSSPHFTYIPQPGYHGPDSFTFIAKDGGLSSSPATISILVRALNRPPVVHDSMVTSLEDTAVEVALAATDADDDVLSFSIVSPPSKGTLTGTAPHFTYTPNPNSNGTDTFTYTAADGSISSGLATVTLNVTPVNDLPTAISATYTLNEDSSVTITLTGSDPDGDPLTYAIEPFSDGSHWEETYVYGDFDMDHLPQVTFTPYPDSTDESRLKFTVSDGTGSSQPATIRFLITPVPDPPQVFDYQLYCREDRPEEFYLYGYDPDYDFLDYTILTQPQHGTLSGEGAFRSYAPAENYTGWDSFTYQINDGTFDSDVVTVSVYVAPQNDPPHADSVSYTLRQRTIRSFTLTGSSVDGDDLRFVATRYPAHGTLSGAGGNLVYKPYQDFSGTDTIEFIAVSNRTNEVSNTATVTFEVTESNLPPLAPDLYVTLAGYTADIVLPGADTEGLPVTYTVGTEASDFLAISGTAPNLTIARYYDWGGHFSFTYSVTDDMGRTETGAVWVNILPGNSKPYIENYGAIYVDEDTATVFRIRAVDPENDPITYSIEVPPGSPYTIEGSGPEFLLRPALNFSGSTSLTARVSDDHGGVTSQVINVEVQPQDDAPVFTVGSATTTAENTPLDLIISASDLEGSAVTYALGSNPLHGTLEGTLPNLHYIPNSGFNGADSFVVTASDGRLTSSITVPLTVTPVNDPPVAEQVAGKFQGLTTAVILNGTDVDGDVLSYRLVNPPSVGTASVTGNLLTVTTSQPIFGTLVFSYVVNDGTVDSTPASIVLSGGVSPEARIISPLAGARMPAGEALVVRIDAHDPDGTIVRYELLANGAPVATSGTPVLSWIPSQTGAAALSVRVTDNDALVFTSAPLHLTITGVNQAPVVFAGSDRNVFSLGLGANLIKNGSCDLPLDGNGNVPFWENVAGFDELTQADAGSFNPTTLGQFRRFPTAADGAFYFGPKNAESFSPEHKTAETSQVVALGQEETSPSRYLFRAKIHAHTHDNDGQIGSDANLREARIDLQFLDAAGEVLSSQILQGGIPNNVWYPVVRELVRPQGAVSLKVELIAFRDVGNSAFHYSLFDDVALYPLISPAPATLAATVSDDGLPTNGSLKTTWTQIGGPPARIIDPAALNASVEFTGAGEHIFTLTATDGETSASDTVAINVGASVGENAPPRISLASEMTVTVGETDYPLVATVTDDGNPGSTLYHSWEQVSGPGKVAFADPRSASTTFNVAVPGAYTLRLHSHDGSLAAYQDIAVQANCELTRQPIDLYIITDHSGSMFGPEPRVITDQDPRTPIYQARRLIGSVLDSLDPSLDRVSINKNDSASYNQAMAFSSDFVAARQSIIKPQGEMIFEGYDSYVIPAIWRAVDFVKTNSRPEARKIILHLNDGVSGPQEGSPALIAENGITTISISMANMKNDPINRYEISNYVSTPAHAFFVDSLSDPAVLDRFFRIALSPLCRGINRAPVVFAGGAKFLPSISSVFQPDATVNDDQDTSTLSFSWEQVSGPVAAQFSDPTQLRPSIRFTQQGSYLFKLTAWDGHFSAPDTVWVKVGAADSSPTPQGLIAYWPFDGSMRDIIGNRTLASQFPNMPPVFVNDSKSGQALDLSARTYPFRQVDGELFNLKGADNGVAVSFWCKTPAAANYGTILQFSGYSTSADGRPYWSSPGLGASYDSGAKLFRFSYELQNGNSATLDSHPTSGAIDPGKWKHMVINYDKSTGLLSTYTDGVLTNTRFFSVDAAPVFARNGQELSIGAAPYYSGKIDWSLASEQPIFSGIVDEVAVFDRTLSASDIADLANRNSGLTPPGLNPPPIVSAGMDRVVSLSQPVLPMDGLVTDDSATVQSGWSLLSGPADGFELSSPELPNSLVTFSKPGIYTFELRANDGYHSVADTVEFRVDQPCQSPLPANALLWLKADGHPGDSFGTNDLKWLNQPAYVAGKVGKAFEFTGSNGMLESGLLDLAGTSEYTFEGWFKDNSNRQMSESLFEVSTAGKLSDPLTIRAGTRINGGGENYIEFTCTYLDTAGITRQNTFITIRPLGADIYPQGQFFHLAISISRTGGISFYVNGVLTSNQTVPSNLTSLSFPTNPVLRLGGRNNSQIYPKLTVDELTMYSRKLDSSEVLSIYQAGSAGKCPPWAQAPANSGFVDAGESAVLPQAGSHAFSGSYEPNDFAANPTFGWSLVQSPVSVSLAGSNTLTPTGSFSVPGRYVFKLTVTDGVKTGTDTVIVDLSQTPNTAPVVDWTPPAFLQLPADTLVLAPMVTDDGLPTSTLHSSWRMVSGPSSVFLTSNTETANPHDVTARFTASGSYEVELLVSDDLLTTSRLVTIQVLPQIAPPAPNEAPSFSLGADITAVALSVHLFPTVFDDGKPDHHLTATWDYDQGPGAPHFDIPAATAGPEANISFPLPGIYIIRLTVSDGELSGTDTIAITVPESLFGPGNVPNAAPVLAGIAPTVVSRPNTELTLEPVFTDPDGPATAYVYAWEQVNGPAPLVFSDTASHATTMTFSALGTYVVKFTLTDGIYIRSSYATIHHLAAPNTPPTLALTPDGGSASPMATVALTATATDDGGAGALTYEWNWLEAPSAGDPVFSSPTLAETQVTFPAAGDYLLTCRVSDGQLSTRRTISYRVTGTANLAILTPQSGGTISDQTVQEAHIRASQDGGSVTSVRLSLDGLDLGQAHLEPDSVDYFLQLPPMIHGGHTLTATAAFSDGGVLSQTSSFQYADFAEEALVLEIDSPYSDSEAVTAPTPVIGTVKSPVLKDYTLDIASIDAPTIRKVIASGTSQATSASLGTLDPTLLENGVYTLTLSGNTINGLYASVSETILIDGNMKLGQFSLAFEDLSINLPGTPLTVTRVYDSRDAKGGDFGPGWTLATRSVKVRKTRPLDVGWEQSVQATGFVSNWIYLVQPTNRKRVVITFPGGRTETFETRIRARIPFSQDQPFAQRYAPLNSASYDFTPVGSTQGRLEVDGDKEVVWASYGGNLQEGPVEGRFAGASGESTDPTRFRYTEPGGASYVVDEALGLLSISEPNGNSVTINRDGVHHSAGESLMFTRDGEGRITQITDPTGKKVTYGYDEWGRLTGFTNRSNQTNRFRYTNWNFPHYLTDIIDAENRPAIRTDYDDAGRMVSQTDAAGKSITFTHAVEDRTETITDRLGYHTTHEFDENGNVTRTTDALGGITSHTYDANDNELSVTTPLGNATGRSFDARNNLLSETDPLGNVSRYTYDAEKRPLSIEDALNHATVIAYNSIGNLTSMTDPAGTSTGFSYGAGGNIASITDANGTTTSYTHDAKGHEQTMKVTAANGAVLTSENYNYDASGNRIDTIAWDGNHFLTTRYSYDNENRLVNTRYPDGRDSSTGYDSNGKKTFETLGNRYSLYTYDSRGHLIQTQSPGNRVSRSGYDAEGRMTSSTDPAGTTTYTIYDPLGRATATILPDDTMPAEVLTEVAEIAASPELADNPRTTTNYDADGRVAASTDPLGNTTAFEYDASGRRTAVVDALGHRTTYAYDAAGHQSSVTDARGGTTSFTYDAAGRPIRTDLPDGNFTLAGYDTLGHRISATDAEGNTTLFAYDPQGRVLVVTDAMNGITRYTYDQRGLQTSQTDALGRTTTYEYDVMGRRTARILPEGQREVTTYDYNGNLDTHTDFNGQTTRREYDWQTNELLAISAAYDHPSLALGHAPAKYDFSYDILGRRTQAIVRNRLGGILHQENFTYDRRSQLTGYSGGTGTIGYGYDAAGNLAGTKSGTAGGYDVSYDYDALNRLSMVHRGQEGIDPTATELAAYNYDANGNLNGSGYANGVQHAYTYNALNRLTHLAVSSSSNQPSTLNSQLSSYSYALNKNGHRTTISELGGRTITNTFDQLYRLTQESITQSGLGVPPQTSTPAGTLSYSYDAVGNRLTRTTSGPVSQIIPSQSQSFTDNDHLGSDTYDANGNTTESVPAVPAGSSSSVTDVYSFDNKLIRRTNPDGTVIDLLYNTDGHRVSKLVSQNGLTQRLTTYLTDANNPTGYAQVIEEKDPLDATNPLRKVNLYGHDLICTDSSSSNQPST